MARKLFGMIFKQRLLDIAQTDSDVLHSTGNKRALHADALQVIAIGIVIPGDVHRADRSGNQGDIDQ